MYHQGYPRGRIGYRLFLLLNTSLHSFELPDFSTLSASLVVAGVVGAEVEGAADFAVVVGGGGAGFFKGYILVQDQQCGRRPSTTTKMFLPRYVRPLGITINLSRVKVI